MKTSEQMVKACLDRIEAREGAVRAWAHLDPDYALAQARARDQEAPKGPLHGVPVGLKDIIDTAELPTEYNSPIYKGHRPKADATCVMQLKAAGCVILGKTVTTEFANNHPSQTRNPHNPAHSPGGSSSGSAAAVGDGMVPLALGTQTGGSVIRPAAYCGAAAIKPSFGAINRVGVKMISDSLDTVGIFSRSSRELALALQVFTGWTPSGQKQKPTIGFCRTPRWSLVDPASQKNLEEAAQRLAGAGAKVSEFDMPAGSEALFDRHRVIMGYETARCLAWEYRTHPEAISKSLRPRLDEGWAVTRTEYDEMRSLTRKLRRQLADKMRDVDILLTPGAPGEAPLLTANSTGNPIFNRAWTLLGLPCVTLPFGKGPAGLPLGVQLVGSFDADMALLAHAGWAESALG